jgi:hypothetical protein
MGERADGTWAAKQVGISAPRQNGKSQLIVARALAGALLFGEQKIVISAHAQDTARETFAKFIEQIDESPALAERVSKVMNALNREFIKFKNGAVVQFKARTVSGSRGFSSDCLLLDEAQILGMPAWVSINSTMSARPNPQIWLLGTPPTPEDNGEVFTRIRNTALGGKSQTLAWLEWAALPADDPALVETRAKANPAWWTRINHEVVQGEFESYPPERFALDRLGIWMADAADNPPFFGEGNWEGCRLKPADVPEEQLHPKPDAIGIGVSLDREWGSIGAAARVDGKVQVGAVDRRRGVLWLIDEAKRIQDKTGCRVAIDGKGPGAHLVDKMTAAGVEVTIAGAGDVCDASELLFDLVQESGVRHFGNDELEDAVEGAAWRDIGDRKAIGRRKSTVDVSMLEGTALATWALHGVEQSPPSPFFLT